MRRRVPSALTQHIERAKQLLDTLEVQAHVARQALAHDGAAEFEAAINARGQILDDLALVVDAIARERATATDYDIDADGGPLLAELARAAAAALESQRELTARAAVQRNRLASALHNVNRPDSVASQYAAAGGARRPVRISVTG